MAIEFTKMHGLGNDFVMVNELKGELVTDKAAFARRVCERHFGIGADAAIFLCSSSKGDARMRIFNPDGSEAEMCGNGIRCFAFFARKHGIKKEKLSVETLAGIVTPEIIKRDGKEFVRVSMGAPRFASKEIPVLIQKETCVSEPMKFGPKSFDVTCVSMGNPHAVIFVDNVDEINLEAYGSKIEKDPLFPKRVNVQFAQLITPTRIKMRTWERGAGVTLACGTGACAVAAAARITNKTRESKFLVFLPGGELELELALEGDAIKNIFLTGPVEEVFEGKLDG
ncbi:MAG: diaminopimelate epimerase [Candidatus Micrarchaeota archaeon]